jgi:glutathione S-transferase
MITLSAFGPMWGLTDPSPFVGKTMIQLKMAGLPFSGERRRPTDGPKGKVPFIDDEGVVVGDSTFIRDHLEQKYGVDLDAGLSPRRRALGWMVERVVEDHLYWATIYFRWAVRENFDKGPANFFAGAPDEVREQAREGTLRSLYGQGFGRHSAEEVADLAGRSLAALSELLGDQAYITGETISGADATLFAGLAAIATAQFDTPLRDALLGHGNLMAYLGRMTEQFHPELLAAEAEPA